MARIRIFRNGSLIRETDFPTGASLYSAIVSSGEYLDAPCGGAGKCGKCLVRLSPDGELLLACKTRITGDTDVYLPENTDMKIAAGVSSSGLHTGPYAAAVDIGTTTVVAHIVDIPSGSVIATAAGVNAQRAYGADVISRIVSCSENGHERQTELIRAQLRSLISDACLQAGLKSSDVTYLSVAGNTVMLHLYNGDSPIGIGRVPFTPVSLYGTELPAGHDLGLSPDAVEYLSPCVHSYVGGDISVGLLASGILERSGTLLFLDVGTNGEMAIRHGDDLYCCATAAGPAFEGAEISCGMAAVKGAVSHLGFDGEKITYTVIDGAEPCGFCGSGLLDALALLLDTGAVDETGFLLASEDAGGPIAGYIGKIGKENAFILNEKTYMTAGDIRKLQLAKAAIAAGIQTMLHHAGVEHADGLLLAGGFGSFMSPQSAARIGLFPAELLPNVTVLGNTAGAGAVLTSCSEDARAAVRRITDTCKYIELSTSKVFIEQYIEQMMFEEPPEA